MKKRILVTNLLLAMFALVSCSSNDDNSIVIPVENTPQFAIPTDKQFRDFQVIEINKLVQTLSGKTDNASMTTFTSKNGVILKSNFLTYVENGNVKEVKEGDTSQLKFVEIYDRAQMVLTNRTTMGTYSNASNPDETKAQFASAGQFYMDMKINNIALEDFTIIMFVPTKNSANKQADMTYWIGDVNDDNNIAYLEMPKNNTMHNVTSITLANVEYYVANLWRINDDIFNFRQIGWTGIHKMKPVEGEKASLSVKAPVGYNISNSAVYVLNKNDEGVLQLNNSVTDQKQSNVFTSQDSWLSVGTDVTLLFMTIDPKTNSVIYALKDLKVEKNQLYTFDAKDLKQSNTNDFSKLVNEI